MLSPPFAFNNQRGNMSGLEEALEAAANGIDQNPRARTPKKSENPVVDCDPNARVWVRITTENQPWSEDKPLLYWKDYEVPLADALVFESRKHAVILKTPTPKGK